jgi:hypothetical protein
VARCSTGGRQADQRHDLASHPPPPFRSTSLHPAMSSPLEIRNSPTGTIIPAIGPLLIAAIFGFFALKGLLAGAPGGRVLLMAVLALGCLGLGLFFARGAFDTPRAFATGARARCWCRGTRCAACATPPAKVRR